MRKIKFLLAIALLVFVFSGCGGSSSSDSGSSDESTDATELHATIASDFTGDWLFNDNDDFSGKVTDSANRSILLYSVKKFKLSIDDVVFDSTAVDSEASATVFYSFSSSAEYEDSNVSLGTFNLKSYTDSSTIKTQEMVLSRISDEEWMLSSGSSNVPNILITRSSSRKISVQLSGTTNFNGSTCDYTITASSMVKNSNTPTTDDDNEDTSDSNTGIKNILEGTWLFSTGEATGETEQATATLNDGSNTSLTLKLASDVNLNISALTLKDEDDTTGLTGTVNVTYSQQWTAYDEYNQMQGSEGGFAFEKKDETMKIIQVENGVWRIEDINNSNENIIITINSNNEIKTVWTGTKDFLGTKCTYSITCLFRKQ